MNVTKEQWDIWERFALSCRQGRKPAVQSEERRLAIVAIADFLLEKTTGEMYEQQR